MLHFCKRKTEKNMSRLFQQPNIQSMGRIQLLLIFVKKLLFECSQAHLFIYCQWLLLHYDSRVSSCDRLKGPQRLKYLLSGPLQIVYWLLALGQMEETCSYQGGLFWRADSFKAEGF